MELPHLTVFVVLISTVVTSDFHNTVSNTRRQTLEHVYKRIRRAVADSSKDSELLKGFQFFDGIMDEIKAGAGNGDDLTRVRREMVGVSDIIQKCCEVIKKYLDKKSDAHDVLCSESDLEQCCKDFGDEIDKQKSAYDVLCPNKTNETTTEAPTTEAPTTEAPTTEAPTTEAPTTEAPFSSCKEILDKYPDSQNGTYKLLGTDGTVFEAYCQMSTMPGCPGGGYTMVMKVDGAKPTFQYNSPLWTNKIALWPENGTSGFDNKETKLPSFWETILNDLCIGMKVGGTVRFVHVRFYTRRPKSLYDIEFSLPLPTDTSLGVEKWKSLVPGASLQPKCNAEGFNRQAKHLKIRIGILGNNEDNCDSPDSFVGVGATILGPQYCDFKIDPVIVAGNLATCEPDNGEKAIRAMAYLLAR